MKSATTCPGATLRRSALGPALLLSTLLGLSACGGGGGTPGAVLVDPDVDGAPDNTGDATLLQVEFGRLVDVYGFRRTDEGLALDLFRADVVIGPDIEDERPTGSTLRDDEVEFDFLAADPDTLSPRLLIPREIGTDDFNRPFVRLSESNRNVTASKFGQDVATRPFTVVPRNAAFKLTFSQNLPVADDFFVVRDANGDVQAVRNTEAIQLLSIQSNPNDANDAGDFVVLPTRIIPRGNQIIIDPVFLGVEGVQYGTRNNASGLPASGDQIGANVRLAIALDGPLKMPGVTLADDSIYRGKNNDGFDSIIRDFRSGNVEDESPDISRGFIRDSEPPRVIGSIPMFLEAVETVDPTTQIITVFKNTRAHEIDRGDIVRIVDGDSGEVLISEVIDEPDDDAGRPGVQHVRVPIRLVDGLSELDPQLRDDYPNNPQNPAGERWLRREAPHVVLVAEYTGLRRDPVTNEVYGDDPANFLVFSPEPFAQVEGYDPFPGEPSLPNVNISPFAGAIVRFSKPVDLQSVKAFDTFFFSTRDVLDPVAQEQFKAEYGLSNQQFTVAKYMTPHLVDARVFDETGSQTVLRLQPVKGFFINEEMRSVPPQDVIQIPLGDSQTVEGEAADPHEGLETQGLTAGAVATSKLPYYLQLVGGLNGIRDLAGNPIDFQSLGTEEHLSIPFFLDGRKFPDGRPFFEDNLVVSIVRRFAAADEDEQPSLYLMSDASEYEFAMADVFGAVSNTADGRLISRPATRVTKVVDDQNQQPVAAQDSIFRYCPLNFQGDGTVATNTASAPFGQGIQNPLNPYGARLQTVWREIDMSLSRVDPFDFNLDVEQMYWAPVTSAGVFFDIFDEVSLFLGHSERRPEPCVGQFSALGVMDESGLQQNFQSNYVRNKAPTGNGNTIESRPQAHAAYQGAQFTINPAQAVLEPNGINRFLPLPEFQQPYFTWRDETVMEQGGSSTYGDDTSTGTVYEPYIISPFLGGVCSPQRRGGGGGIQLATPRWDNRENIHTTSGATDNFTDGLLGSIALPLLADFQTICDSPDLPANFGFIANGFNGWQISLTVQSGPLPAFRAFTGGTPNNCATPQQNRWANAQGQSAGGGIGSNDWRDNSLYWVMADFLKRQTVATSGFVEVLNPHRMPPRESDDIDPRLGPYFDGTMPATRKPNYEWHFEPPLASLPAGTEVVPEFRAASRTVDRTISGQNWPPINWGGGNDFATLNSGQTNPHFALNPLVAGDAHIRKYDRRSMFSGPRNYWSRYYNEHVSDYTLTINDITDDTFLNQFAGNSAGDNFRYRDAIYFNWRFVMSANTTANPPVSPAIESFAISYRFESTIE